MQIYYTLDELPASYQTQFKNGFELENTDKFYPAETNY